MTYQTTIDKFLNEKRIAIVGVSRNPSDYSRAVFRKFLQLGYLAIPVNPNADEIDGIPCFPDVTAIAHPPSAALLLTSAESTWDELQGCSNAGIKLIWSRHHLDERAKDFCEAAGMLVVDGYCPFLFFPDSAGVHKLHGLLLKLVGQYPEKEPAFPVVG